MAIVVVLIFATVLLMLGASYLNTLSNVRKTNIHVLRQHQANFLALGLQRIALLKFKKFPADFYHAYFHQVAKNQGVKGLSPLSPLPTFHEANNSILQNFPKIADPIGVSSYSIGYRMISHKAYSTDGLEIYTSLRLKDDIERNYKMTLLASRTLVP